MVVAKHTKSSKEKEEDISQDSAIDFSAVQRFFSSLHKNKILITILLILFIILVTFYIRNQTVQLKVTDDWAQNSVYSFYRNQIASQVNTQYPNLPAANKDALINKQFDEFVKTNKANLDIAIQQTSENFRSRITYEKGNDKQAYLGDLDSYYWLRMTRNIINHGNPCDTVVNGSCMDTYVGAPLGGELPYYLHPYAIFVSYKFFAMLYPNTDMDLLLMRSSFYVPVFIAILTAILAFFIARRVSGNLGGTIAGLLVSANILFVSRTSGSDTDIWNVFFAVLVIYLFFEAFMAKKLIPKYILLFFAALSIGVFSFAWTGWWYMFDFLLASFLIFLGYLLFKTAVEHRNLGKIVQDKRFLQTLLLAVAFFILTGIFVTLISGFGIFMNFFTGPFGFANIKDATTPSLWPNIFTTVAELNEANLGTIVSQAGGALLFMLALLGTIFWLVKNMKFTFKDGALFFFSVILFYFLATKGTTLDPTVYFVLLLIPIILMLLVYMKNVDQDESSVKFSILLAIWFLGTMYASLKGVRFILLLTPIIGISAGIILSILYQKIKELIAQSLKLKGIVINIILILVIFFIVLQPVRGGYVAAKGFVPSISDGWVDSLQAIKQGSSKEAIINSWWDFGHWFKYWADRRVTLDGVSQNNPQAQWLGRLIQTSNSDETVGILRMLDCGANNAFDEVNKKLKDAEFSYALVDEVILQENKSGAEQVLLQNGFSKQEAANVLQYTHCTPPEDYYITSSDMIGKAGVWAHFGLWDFRKAYLVENVRNKNQEDAIALMKSRYNYTEDVARKIYFDLQSLSTQPEINAWIAAWPNYLTSTSNCVVSNSTKSNLSMGSQTENIICYYNAQIGNNGQNVIVLESINATFNKGVVDTDSLKLNIGAYDPASGAKLGGSSVQPSLFYYSTQGSGSLKNISTSSKDFTSAILLAKVHEGYVSVVADPTLIDSMFTQLYYLDGVYVPDHFKKFHEDTTVFGERIVVWKVVWPGK